MTTERNIKTPVYLDYQSTTPVDPRALEAMLPWFTEKFGNPHSTSHELGRESAEAVEEARGKIADLVNADPREIVFTSGATESNNLAIKGAARFERAHRNKRDKIVSVVTEHKCVIESVKAMEAEGFETVFLPVGANGLVDRAALDAAVDDRTVLVSIMAANNEIGVLQPVAEIGALARERGALFHTDAAQAIGKTPIDVEAMTIDLMSISGHKVYGPKGIGVLYMRRRPRARLEPLFSGGGQERTIRSGTVPTPLVVGLGEAAAIAKREMGEEGVRLGALRDHLWQGIQKRIPDVALNGDPDARLAANLNIAFDGIKALDLIEGMPDLAVSTGSACTSAVVEPSYVLRALGLDDDRAGSSIRIGLGRFTTEAEVEFALDHLAEAVLRLRQHSSAA
ncbi:MAG: aminotransferase class V-fold PLP-dependent enzyme [Pseudomonadota bacterium]